MNMKKSQAEYIAKRLRRTGHNCQVISYEERPGKYYYGVSYDGCGHQGHPWGCTRNTPNADEFNGKHKWPCGVTVPTLPPSLQ